MRVDRHDVQLGVPVQRGRERPVTDAQVEMPAGPGGQLRPGPAVAGQRVPVERAAGRQQRRVQRLDQPVRVRRRRQRRRGREHPVLHRAVAGDRGGQRRLVPGQHADPAAGSLPGQVGHLVVVAHLPARRLPRHRDRHLPGALHQPHGVAAVGHHDVGVPDPAQRLGRRQEGAGAGTAARPTTSRSARRRRARAQRRDRADQPVERPRTHPDRDEDRAHQSSPTSTARRCRASRCGRCTTTWLASRAHSRAASPARSTMLNVSTHTARTPAVERRGTTARRRRCRRRRRGRPGTPGAPPGPRGRLPAPGPADRGSAPASSGPARRPAVRACPERPRRPSWRRTGPTTGAVPAGRAAPHRWTTRAARAAPRHPRSIPDTTYGNVARMSRGTERG